MNSPEPESTAPPDPDEGRPVRFGPFVPPEDGPYPPEESESVTSGAGEEFAPLETEHDTPFESGEDVPAEPTVPQPEYPEHSTQPEPAETVYTSPEAAREFHPSPEPEPDAFPFSAEAVSGEAEPDPGVSAMTEQAETFFPATLDEVLPGEPTYRPPGVPDAEVALLCEGLERFLGEGEARVHVLRGVSLRLEPGFVHAVVGPSGCGKSSLLYILGLLDRPDAGRLTISGRPVADLPDDELSRQRNALLGFIFQFHFLLQDFTAQENVMIPMRQLGVLGEAAMRERALHLLDSVGMGEKGQRPSRHLSGGEQQRVAIARALANDPQVILADEPTGNLDTANSTRVFSLLTDLVHRENKALLLVTHNPAIATACDWIHTMRDGQIVEQHYAGARR